jgi:hypothetical protein
MTDEVTDEPTPRRCPECGRGVLATITHDETPPGSELDLAQQADSRQIETYTCGHMVTGPKLSGADANELEVERRTADEVTDTSEID